MTRSLNRVTLIGNLGRDPEVRSTQSGDKVATLSIATSESWKDRTSGEQREKTEWHRVVLWKGLANVAERYLNKGDKVYIEGQLQTRKWQDQSGQDKYTTEVSCSGFGGCLIMLGGGSGDGARSNGGYGDPGPNDAGGPGNDDAILGGEPDLDDEIPF